MEKENKKRVLLLIVSVIIGIALILVGVYFLFFKKEEPKKDNTNELPPEVEVAENKIELFIDDAHAEVSRAIKLGINAYDFKLLTKEEGKYELYLQDEKIETIEYSSIVVYLVDRYLIVGWPGAQGGTLALGYVNEAGNYSRLYPNNSIYDIYFESGFMYGNVEVPNSEVFDTKIVKITFTTPSKVTIENVK